MKTLKESILSGANSTIKRGDKLANDIETCANTLPTIKDFNKIPGNKMVVSWNCERLIQKYISSLDLPEFNLISKSDICGIRIWVDRDKDIATYLFSKNNDFIELPGVGGWVGNNVPFIKRECIEFFKYISSNPDSLIKVFEHAMKCQNELDKKGMCDNDTWRDILKY